MAEFAGKVTLLEIEGAGEGASAQLGFILMPSDGMTAMNVSITLPSVAHLRQGVPPPPEINDFDRFMTDHGIVETKR